MSSPTSISVQKLARLVGTPRALVEAGMTLYDAFYLWCRDAVGEAHNWPSVKQARRS